MPARLNLKPGDVFNYFTVISEHSSGTGDVKWLCKCRCGKEKIVPSRYLKGHTKSCGCLVKELLKKRTTTHGLSGHKIYFAWRAMKERCINENSSAYQIYGGRGIKICERWVNSFENFNEDMGGTFFKGATLERSDVNGNYEKGNCKWITKTKQMDNKQNTVYIEYNGSKKTIIEWSEEMGISKVALRSRYYRHKGDLTKIFVWKLMRNKKVQT